MIVQARPSAPSFSNKEQALEPRPSSFERFLKEALDVIFQLRVNVDSALYGGDAHDDGDTDDGTVTWKLHLSPPMLTLDTNIQTISGLEQVLEQLRVNITPRPPKIRAPRSVSSRHFIPSSLLRAVESSIRLSAILSIPKINVFRKYNSQLLMRQCVQAFTMCDGAFFLDSTKLMADMSLVMSHADAPKTYPTETLLVLSICSLSIRHAFIHKQGHPSVATGLAHAYYSQARMLLQDLFDVQHISVIQSLLILSLFPYGHVDMFSPARISSPLLTTAIRAALGMNLHRIDATDQPPSNDVELKRRVAWILFCADYFADWNTTGNTGLIDVTYWHVDFVRPIAGEPLARRVEYFSEYCRMVTLRKLHLFGTSYMMTQRSSKAMKLAADGQLFPMYFNTPPNFALHLNPEERSWQKEDLEPLLLHRLYADTLIMTHVPFLPRRYLASLDNEAPTRETDMKNVYQRIVHLSGSTSFVSPFPSFPPYTSHASGPTCSSSSSSQNPFPSSMAASESNAALELHCILGILTAAHQYTHIMEALVVIDPLGCFQSPVHGILIIAYVSHMIQTNCQDPDAIVICRVNLVRLLRIFQQVRNVYSDPALLYIERLLSRWITSLTDGSTPVLRQQVMQRLNAVRERTNLLMENSSDVNDGQIAIPSIGVVKGLIISVLLPMASTRSGHNIGVIDR
ncbi:uncharacterized protein BYT42DRAFT_549240 [Radiomyces spectabilis]|uniref:uncharacterized protein n=1 Tax=Radiomyces spectabilis TaxID=64574 RepID=UPI00221F8993|nr:uncharacterized protein BYT42DRAFT_549240 [Radiomyces spectabilis]KAI8369580.1 hypothetical protein BYT42DRAFT_549240 [Radiomyces spectabilis]